MAKPKLNVLPRVTVSKTRQKPSRPFGAIYPFNALTLVGHTFTVENIPYDKVDSVRVQASKQGAARGVRYRVFTHPRCSKCGAKATSGKIGIKCRNCEGGRLYHADVEVKLNSMTR